MRIGLETDRLESLPGPRILDLDAEAGQNVHRLIDDPVS